MIRPTQTNCASWCEHHFRYNFSCLKDKRIGARQLPAKKLKNWCRNSLSVFLNFCLISADECQRLFWIRPGADVLVFDLLHSFHCFFTEDTAAQSINCICGINYDSIVFQNIHDLLNAPRLRVYWIDTQKHEKNTKSQSKATRS